MEAQSHRAIAALRRARGWSREDLSIESGIDVETIRAIEGQTRICDPTTADAFIRAFVCGNDDATWLAILCAQSFAQQYHTALHLLDAECAGEA